ncbi:MAG: hypothetical protein JWP29_2750 [Rhodoferax sp.]|nr:hypothetical protein [Rhodoferax sp.]
MQLVDTNVISELMRQRPDAGVLQWAKQSSAVYSRLALSVVCVDEIVYGLSRRPEAAKLSWFDGFCALHDLIEISETIARRAGAMRAVLAARGQVRSQADMLIAATAQVHALTLVTRNVRDFDGCSIAVLNPFADSIN